MTILTARKTLASAKDEAVRQMETAMQAATAEGRELTEDERTTVQTHLDEAKAIKARLDNLAGDDTFRAQMEQFKAESATRTASAVSDGETRGRQRLQSIGEQFVASDQYRANIRGHARPRGWSSPTIELSGGMRAATLTTDAASGGDLVVPTYQAGITELRFERLTVSDLLAQGQTDSNAIIYMKETTATNAAATVAEGAIKPESTLIFDAVTDVVKKIATWLPVTDEMLDDVPQIRSYIDNRLKLFVEITEEAQLLNGDGLGTNLVGLRNRVGLQTDVVRNVPIVSPAENNMDAIHRMITQIMTTSFLMPDGIVMHPSNWQTIALSKDTSGQYLAAGPFNASQQYRLWGLPVVPTTAMTAGVALVGAYRTAAQVFRKGGIAVEATNSHSDFFTKNLMAIRAEERLALAVYRPAGFGEVTTLL